MASDRDFMDYVLNRRPEPGRGSGGSARDTRFDGAPLRSRGLLTLDVAMAEPGTPSRGNGPGP